MKLTPEDIEGLCLPWKMEGEDEEYVCVVNAKGTIVVPSGPGSPDWMNNEWPTENEAIMIVQAVNERQSLLDRIAHLESQLEQKTAT